MMGCCCITDGDDSARLRRLYLAAAERAIMKMHIKAGMPTPIPIAIMYFTPEERPDHITISCLKS